MEYNLKIDGLDKLISKAGVLGAQEVIEKPLHQGALLLQAWSQKNRLTGPRPKYLGVKTGRLRSSITVSRSIKRGEYKFFIGTNVEYASIHEFGGTIQRRPRSSLFVQNRYTKGSRKGAFKKGGVRGRGFTYSEYTQTIPARPFLRPSIEDEGNQKRIIDLITTSINEALNK